ncbi:hypothetical protein ACFL05_00925, partial [Patescibacteria group bacterium]
SRRENDTPLNNLIFSSNDAAIQNTNFIPLNNMSKNILKKGISLLEVVIGISIIFVLVVSVVSTYNFFFRVAQKNTKTVKVEFLLEEGAEALRSIRDSGWEDFVNISSDTDHHLIFEEGVWKSTENNIYTDDIFERKFIITDVYRDNEDDISETGTLDSGSKKAEVFVSWSESGATTTQSISTILTNLFDS